MDVVYHNKCWTIHVTNVLRTEHVNSGNNVQQQKSESLLATEIEFLSILSECLNRGSILTVASSHDMYMDIAQKNYIIQNLMTRRELKSFIEQEIPGIEFFKPLKANESERIILKDLKDVLLQEVENKHMLNSELKTLLNAAKILRREAINSDKWEFKGSLTDSCDDNIPGKMLRFFRWFIQGTSDNVVVDKAEIINKRATILAQSALHYCLTPRQLCNDVSTSFRDKHEMPHQLAVGISVHQATRSKKLIQLLHGLNVSVDIYRILRLETQIASEVTNTIEKNGGVYIPSDIVPGRFVFFAADNIDFQEDTADGKHTLHGTILAIYQQCSNEDTKIPLKISGRSSSLTIKKVSFGNDILPCYVPKTAKPQITLPLDFTSVQPQIDTRHSLPEYAWLISKTISDLTYVPTQNLDEDNMKLELQGISKNVPSWSGYNSVLYHPKPLTKVNAAPLIASPAHEFSTLLTVFTNAQNINAKVVGPNHKTVITLDMDLYIRAKKLQYFRNDPQDTWIFRCGELHIVMAQLRTIGSYIENSGIDEIWVESGMFSSVTVKQILDGKHVNRAIEAHCTTLQALFRLYISEFLRRFPEYEDRLIHCSQEVDEAWKNGSAENIALAHSQICSILESQLILEKFEEFDHEKSQLYPVYTFARQYMDMILQLLLFVRSVRTANFELHLRSLEGFTKYFFAHDKLNYARMIPVYLAEMKSLKSNDPMIWEEFCNGNWIVNKSLLPFCSIGPDHALEQINRCMKISGGLVGISLNENARDRFFLAAPELLHLVKEANDLADIKPDTGTKHHSLKGGITIRQLRYVTNMISTFTSFTNPFSYDGEQLINLVTKSVMTCQIKEDVCKHDEVGLSAFKKFHKDRIEDRTVNIWDPMKKINLKTFNSASKKVKIQVKGAVIELKEDRGFFARLMIVVRSRPELNLQECIGKYELSVVPRSLFSFDGDMHHCSIKSNLMKIIESIPKNITNNIETEELNADTSCGRRVAIVDGMAEVQALNKPSFIKTCDDLADHFISRLNAKYGNYDEVHYIFDDYSNKTSLKAATRKKRTGGIPSIRYKIDSTTKIECTPLIKLLSHTHTKDELSTFFADKILKSAQQLEKDTVVVWRKEIASTFGDFQWLASTHEEADTKIVLHAVSLRERHINHLDIYSPDTDVFVLLIRRYQALPNNCSFITGVGPLKRRINLKQVSLALGVEKVKALPGFYSFTGADITGAFSGKGKLSCWKVFLNSDLSVLNAFQTLGSTARIPESTYCALESFVCRLYDTNTNLTNVNELRWEIFRHRQWLAEKLPPTKAALIPAIQRAHHQAMIWWQDDQSHPNIPSPCEYGWKEDSDGLFNPVLCTPQSALDIVVNLVKYSCK